jgi:sugar lactone lactonase YvrE
MKAELLHRCKDEIGEAATWLDSRKMLLWTDIPNGIVHFYDFQKKYCFETQLDGIVSSIIPIKNNPEEVFLTMQNELVRFHLNKKSIEKVFEFNNPNEIRANDSKASPEGRLWIGMMNVKKHDKTGSLWSLDSNLTLKKVLDNQCIPNGIVWNKSGDRMYYADSGRRCIEEYAYDSESGKIQFVREVISVPNEYGVPDGMTTDSEGNLWVAHWGGFGVYVWDSLNGKLLDKIEIPVPNVASCTFGGENNQILLVTTARSGLTKNELSKYPLSGSLFFVKTDVKGGTNHYPFQILISG